MMDIQDEEYIETVLNETTPAGLCLSQSVPQQMNTSYSGGTPNQSQEQLNMTK